jgi:phosphatidylserine/phosphatidylglycerophosphate/cardiolipin synthase-like enzyme
MRAFFVLILLCVLAVGGYLFWQQATTADQQGNSYNSRPKKRDLLSDIKRQASTLTPSMPSFGPSDSSASSGDLKTVTYYAPENNLEKMDATVIANSRCDHLDIAMYSFTDYEVARQVLAFANSNGGRPVRLYRDADQFSQEKAKGGYVLNLLRGNPNIAIRVKRPDPKDPFDYMHLKAYSDGCLVRDGSANWSPSGLKNQDNSLTLSNDPGMITAFEKRFSSIWDRPDNITIQ